MYILSQKILPIDNVDQSSFDFLPEKKKTKQILCFSASFPQKYRAFELT